MRAGMAARIFASSSAATRSKKNALREVGDDALRDVFACEVILRIDRDRHAICAPRLLPTCAARVIRLERRMRGLVQEHLFEHAVRAVPLALLRVDEHVLVPASEEVQAAVDPHRVEVAEKERREPSHRLRVAPRFALGVLARHLRVDLHLHGHGAPEPGFEEIRVERDPALHAAVVDGPRATRPTVTVHAARSRARRRSLIRARPGRL